MAISYSKYNEVKESGIVWLGKVPSHWKLLRFKNVLTEKKKKTNGELPAGSISFGNVVYKNSENLADETKGAYQEVLAGEFLINPLNLNYDLISLRTALSQIDVVVSTGYIVLISNGRLLKNYLRWLLQVFDVSHMKTLGAGVRQTINYSDIGNSFFFEPTSSEQTTIAAFLDYETRKIDYLIKKQQELIALLREKLQSEITRLVTKGFDSQCKMSDSKVVWLGKIPSHWKVKKLKHLVTAPLMYGANEAAIDTDTNNPRFIRITDVTEDGGLKNDTFCSLPESVAKPYLLKDGDILLARTGGTVGKSFRYSNSWGRCCFAGYLIKASLNQNEILSDWFYQYAQTNYYWDWIASSQIQATLPNVSAEKYNNFQMAIPPILEQHQILKIIDRKVDLYRSLITNAESAIRLLHERRTAIISAAITGKIDLRNWQPPKQKETDPQDNKEVTA